MELVFIVRDQEDGGSNPLAPTNFIETSNLQHAEKAKDILVVSKTVRLSCASTNENAVATAADIERATQIEFGSVSDDSTAGAVRINDSAVGRPWARLVVLQAS